MKTVLKNFAKEFGYVPYTGAGGPELEQVNQNTKALAKFLKKSKIPFTEDYDYLEEMTGDSDQLLLKFPMSNGDTIYVGYDRWGFIIEGDVEPDDTQYDWNQIIEEIKKLKKNGNNNL